MLAISRVLALAAAMFATAAFADTTSFSSNLGLIVGSAELCDYRLSDDAVSAYVAKNVPASDLDFAANFQMLAGYHRREAEKLQGLELRVHCEAAKRSAAHLGLLAP